MLATLTKDSGMERAANSYVRSLFDEYAEGFESSLVDDLKYVGFELVRAAFDRSEAEEKKKKKYARTLDVGCGTGLLGEQVRTYIGGAKRGCVERREGQIETQRAKRRR